LIPTDGAIRMYFKQKREIIVTTNDERSENVSILHRKVAQCTVTM
jgi:hypothetical protein